MIQHSLCLPVCLLCAKHSAGSQNDKDKLWAQSIQKSLSLPTHTYTHARMHTVLLQVPFSLYLPVLLSFSLLCVEEERVCVHPSLFPFLPPTPTLLSPNIVWRPWKKIVILLLYCTPIVIPYSGWCSEWETVWSLPQQDVDMLPISADHLMALSFLQIKSRFLSLTFRALPNGPIMPGVFSANPIAYEVLDNILFPKHTSLPEYTA